MPDMIPLFVAKYRKLATKVIDVSIENDGIFVSLNRHWCFNPQEHTRAFDTKREALAGIRDARPCKCDDCVSGNNW